MSDNPKLEVIDRAHALLERRNHFELLGLEIDSPPELLEKQFSLLKRQWHPDAYASMSLDADRERKVVDLFQRINEAYETLKDPTARAEYITLIQRQKAGLQTNVEQILQAEGLVDDALALMRQKKWSEAVSKLEEARAKNPDDPLYGVHLAWATYHLNTKKNGPKAAQMLKDAVKNQENLAIGYQYLGQIEFADGRYAHAIKWWKKCLEWEPKNVEAGRGIRLANTRMEKEKKSGWLSKLFGR